MLIPLVRGCFCRSLHRQQHRPNDQFAPRINRSSSMPMPRPILNIWWTRIWYETQKLIEKHGWAMSVQWNYDELEQKFSISILGILATTSWSNTILKHFFWILKEKPAGYFPFFKGTLRTCVWLRTETDVAYTVAGSCKPFWKLILLVSRSLPFPAQDQLVVGLWILLPSKCR